MAVETFRLKTEYAALIRRAIPLDDATLLNPHGSNPLEMGEFLEMAAGYKLIRSGGSALSWALADERGRTDAQAIGKVSVLFLGGYEAETLIFDSIAPPALGAALMVDDVTYLTLTKSGLKTHGGGAELVVGYVTKTSQTNGGYLRFVQTMV